MFGNSGLGVVVVVPGVGATTVVVLPVVEPSVVAAVVEAVVASVVVVATVVETVEDSVVFSVNLALLHFFVLRSF